MKKKILWGTVLILIAGIAAGAFWWSRRPQVLTFSDDSTVTLLAVDYGKHHTPPAIQMPVAAPSNRPVAARPGRGGPFTTTDDTLVVWVRQQYDSSSRHLFQYFAYDKAGTACVRPGSLHPGNVGPGDEVMGIEFTGFPRRQGKFYVAVQENSNGGPEISDQRLAIANPAHVSSTAWKAAPLPTTVSDEDLSVTLNELTAGADMPYTQNSDNPDDPINKGVKAAFHVERNGQPVSNWQPVSVETSDATGNHVSGSIPSWSPGNNQPNDWANGDGSVTYQYGLWPDESAWKVRFEFSEQSDFAPDEVWNVPHVPLLPGRMQEMTSNVRKQTMTNAPFAEMDVNGYHLKLFPAKQFTNAGMNNYMQGGLFILTTPTLAAGYRMTVKATDDQSNEVQCSEYSGPRKYNLNYCYRLADISGLTNLNVSIALHKSHFVEFTVKPDKAALAAAQ